MFHLTLVTVICIFTIAESVSTQEVAGAPSNCTVQSNTSTTAYLRWPVSLSCGKLFESLSSEKQRSFTGMSATCIIRSFPSSEVVSNKTVQLVYFAMLNVKKLNDIGPSLIVTEELPSVYEALLQIGDACWYQTVKLNKTVIPSNYSGLKVTKYEAIVNETQVLVCQSPSFLKKFKNELQFRWKFNSDETLPSNIDSGEKAIIRHTGFENAGKYVCFVKYLEQEMATSIFDVCVQYVSSTHDRIAIKCPDKVSAPLGGDASIKCVSDVANGKANRVHLYGTWYRATNITEELCDSREGTIQNSSIETEGDRIQCTMKSSIEKKLCYTKRPIEGQQQDKYTISITIKNLKPSDFGEYVVVHGAITKPSSNRTIILTIDKTAERERKIAGVTAAAVIMAMIIILVFLLMWKKKDIKWYWKKHYGPYEKELFTYTAYFAYYYDYERGEESMKKTKSLIVNLHNFMDKFGGAVYDDARNHNVHRFDVDNILQVQSDCHRIIILLTPEFLTDEWSRLKAYSALTEAIESGRKTIFIYISGTKSAIKTLDQPSRTAITSAMKRNITIKWDGKTPLSGRFKRELEYALPKLQKREYGRFLSDSSQAQLTHVNKCALKSDSESNEYYANDFSSAV